MPVPYWYWDVAGDEPFPAPNMDDNDSYSPLFYLKRMLGWLQVKDYHRGSKIVIESKEICRH